MKKSFKIFLGVILIALIGITAGENSTSAPFNTPNTSGFLNVSINEYGVINYHLWVESKGGDASIHLVEVEVVGDEWNSSVPAEVTQPIGISPGQPFYMAELKTFPNLQEVNLGMQIIDGESTAIPLVKVNLVDKSTEIAVS